MKGLKYARRPGWSGLSGILDLSGLVGRNRIVTSFLVGVVFLLLAQPSLHSIVAGLPIVLLGEAVRTWSSGYIRKNQELAMIGPYALTRNPLYFGNGLLGFGFVVMGQSWLLLLLFIPLFTFLYRSTIRKEEERLRTKFGERLSEYVRTVPCFFPRWGGWAAVTITGFDWGLVIKHREYQTWLGILLALLLMIVKVG